MKTDWDALAREILDDENISHDFLDSDDMQSAFQDVANQAEFEGYTQLKLWLLDVSKKGAA